MDQDLQDLLTFFASNFPLTALFAIALWKKWIYPGWIVERLLKNKDDMIIFLDSLRQEAIKDKHTVEERASKQNDNLTELTDVVREFLDFNRTLLGEFSSRTRRGTTRTAGRTSRDT